MNLQKCKKVDIIVSCYNEEYNIIAFYDEAKKFLTNDKYHYNIVYVDDGSIDNTYENILTLIENNNISNINISYISFIHNYGHEAAMCAGLDSSNADYIIFLDVDLQNPPSKIPKILEEFEKGVDVVLLRRVKYEGVSLFKKFTSNAYYLFSKYILFNKNARNVSDYFGINRDVADIVKTKYRTRLRFIRSFVQAEAKNISFVDYVNGVRKNGVSRYNYIKLTKLAMVSELSRFSFFRNLFKETKNKPIYEIKEKNYK